MQQLWQALVGMLAGAIVGAVALCLSLGIFFVIWKVLVPALGILLSFLAKE